MVSSVPGCHRPARMGYGKHLACCERITEEKPSPADMIVLIESILTNILDLAQRLQSLPAGTWVNNTDR